MLRAGVVQETLYNIRLAAVQGPSVVLNDGSSEIIHYCLQGIHCR